MQNVDGLAALAALLADPTRARFLLELKNEAPLPATELATRAGVSSPAASLHLKRLQQAGAVTIERSGRQRLFELANPKLGRALEALQAAAPPPSRSTQSHARLTAVGPELKLARTCYDHLAGELGIALIDSLLAHDLLVPEDDHFYKLTQRGRRELSAFGIDLTALEGKRRPLARACPDWTERRPHLAGSLGAALADRIFQLGWIKRRPPTRSVFVTQKGRKELAITFEIDGIGGESWAPPADQKKRPSNRPQSFARPPEGAR
jgi:DNA-binding transcriptional ArsR family regulator